MKARYRAIAAFCLTGAVLLLGVLIASSQADSRAQLDQRFAARADLAGRFTSSYVADLLNRERGVAADHLSASQVGPEEFARVVRDQGFEAAVLLDDQGRLLAVVPSNPTILHSVIAPKYAHLTAAEAGRVAISGVVKGAATGRPVVAFATPFETTLGRRVFSGAFDVGRSPLSAFLSDSLPYRDATSVVVDTQGLVVASSQNGPAPARLDQLDPGLASATRTARATLGTFASPTGPRLYAIAHPSGTPWTLVNTVPAAELYAPLSLSGQVLPWVVLAGLAVAGCTTLLLVLRLADSRAGLAKVSVTDALTGLPNRRAWDTELPRELARAKRLDLPVSVAMIDLDRFKAFNDQHGHQAGDRMLEAAARAWGGQLREVDFLARYGGEEFALLLPGSTLSQATGILERLRSETPSAQTASAGCAEWDREESAEMLVGRADAFLYEAKAAGGDHVVAHPNPDRARQAVG